MLLGGTYECGRAVFAGWRAAAGKRAPTEAQRPGRNPGSASAATAVPALLRAGKGAVDGRMATQTLPAKRPVTAIEYLYSDGKTMAESARHVDAILYAHATLCNRFQGSRCAQVAANIQPQSSTFSASPRGTAAFAGLLRVKRDAGSGP